MTLFAEKVAVEKVEVAQARIRALIESGKLTEATDFARRQDPPIEEEWVQEWYGVWREKLPKQATEKVPEGESWSQKIAKAKARLNGKGPQIDAALKVSARANEFSAQLNEAIAKRSLAEHEAPEPEPSGEALAEAEPQPKAEPDMKEAGLPALLPVAASAAEQVTALNAKHAVINDYGSKCVVLTWKSWDVDRSVLVPSFQSFDDFRKRYAHRYVETETDKGTRREAAGSYWLKNPGRQTYEAVTFEPGECEVLRGNRLNLWRGLAIKPRPGKCGLFRDHIYGVLADGDPKGGETSSIG